MIEYTIYGVVALLTLTLLYALRSKRLRFKIIVQPNGIVLVHFCRGYGNRWNQYPMIFSNLEEATRFIHKKQVEERYGE